MVIPLFLKPSTVFEYLGHLQYLVIIVSFLKDICHGLWKETESLFLKNCYSLSVHLFIFSKG